LLAPAIVAGEEQALPPRVALVEDSVVLLELEQKYGAQLRRDFQEFAVVQCQELVDVLLADQLPGMQIADNEFLDRLWEDWALSFDVDALQEPFPGPTLVLTGRQDSWCGYEDTWTILEHYPRATFAILDRAGHALQYEQRGLFNALVNDWLDRVEEYRSD
jgi:pimeloyl-ACP methyl ester carboxylesterase